MDSKETSFKDRNEDSNPCTGVSESFKYCGLVGLLPDSMVVSDADEEVFLLYTRLSAGQVADGSTPFRGLGHVDSRKDTLSVTFDLRPPASQVDVNALQKKNLRKSKKRCESGVTVEVELIQDKTALHSRKGDTGSVLWRASVEFARMILQQYHFTVLEPFLDPNSLPHAHVLELGAGTGLLGVVLAPLVRQYTVTDVPALLPLIRKNISLNYPFWPKTTIGGPTISVEELDWVALQSIPIARRPDYLPSIKEDPPDLILAVDCIYHPSLVGPFIEAINFTSGPKTSVVVVSELRAEDVVREFLESWLNIGGWEIWSGGAGLLGMPYAVWIGRRRNPSVY